MPATLAFDIYGTLIDTHGISQQLQTLIGERATAFSRQWRDKQLEYSFRRGLMNDYVPFSVCTRQALDYCCAALNCSLTTEQRDTLMAAYRSLPAFADTASGLATCQAAGHRLYAFSNGRADDVYALLDNAGLAGYFADVVSVDEIGSFKPDPAVYQLFLSKSGGNGGETCLISSNPFDILGAMNAGWRTAWIQRGETVFDPWERQPEMSMASLDQLADVLKARNWAD